VGGGGGVLGESRGHFFDVIALLSGRKFTRASEEKENHAENAGRSLQAGKKMHSESLGRANRYRLGRVAAFQRIGREKREVTGVHKGSLLNSGAAGKGTRSEP